ncbi:TPA: alcohol dehydrogenase catalytic domain-containing protein [Pseudomonas aeruginosa]
MTLQIRGYAAQSASAPLAAHRFERRAPRADDLVIDILYCGVCHSDLHQARNEWHNSLYPLVPGHEIIGRVASVGEAVSGFAVGELVGVGCMVDSCRHCAACAEGLEQYCAEYPTLTYNGRDRHDGLPTFGGIAETQEMLDFCATHGIACDIEMIEIQQINQAYERMLASDVKYRFVIDMASLPKSF